MRDDSTRLRLFRPSEHNTHCTIPAYVIHHHDSILLLDSHSIQIPTQPSSQNCDLCKLICGASAWMKQNWGNAILSRQTIDDIITEYKNDNIWAADDGSVKNGHTAHSWCLFRKSDFKIKVCGVASVGSNPTYITSYRPECCSVLAAATIL